MRPAAIIICQGLFEIIGLGSFLVGYFIRLEWLMIFGGLLVVLDDVIEILMGILKPLFPVILALALALIFTPWYVGVFWASAAFKILGIPTSFIKIFAPQKIIEIGFGIVGAHVARRAEKGCLESDISSGIAKRTNRHVPIIWGIIYLAIAVFIFIKFNGWWSFIVEGILLMLAGVSLKTGFFASDKEIRELTGPEPVSEETEKKFQDRI